MFTKKDLIYSVITGLYAGFIAWQVLIFLKVNILGLPLALLVIIVPIAWIVGINLGYFLGKWIPFFNQFGRFSAVGFTNFAVYWGILNLFIAYTGLAFGIWYSVFIGIAFIVGTVHSYLWNKYWVFESGSSKGGTSEFTKFISVAVVGGLVNIGIASLLVNVIGTQLGISPERWANIGGIVGSASALAFSFIGFRVIVFKTRSTIDN